MKKHSQWLQYLAALSLTFSSTAFALPAGQAPQDEVRISEQASAKLNSIAQDQLANPDAADKQAQWLQWIQWIQSWGQIIIVVPVFETLTSADQDDFGTFAELLEDVKRTA